MKNFISDISKKEFPEFNKVLGKNLRPSIFDLIKADFPGFTEESSLAISELNHYRQKYISNCVLKDIGEITELEKNVLSSIEDAKLISQNSEDTDVVQYTFGQRIADKVASFGGSWTFIISFGVFILIWICLNVIFLNSKSFDPYPFILLNLILSCIAALQAPVIMMSQNRQEEKDRERAKNDYMINLKSELEIRLLHEKIDHLILHQQQELFEMQKVQIEMMNNILSKLDKTKI